METVYRVRVAYVEIGFNFPLSRKLIEWKRKVTSCTGKSSSSLFPLSRKLIEWKPLPCSMSSGLISEAFLLVGN